jgi:transcriptional regulator with XRE-family HTH domain
MIKQRYLLLLFVMILSTICFFYFSTNSIKAKINKIDDYDEAIKEEQEKLNSARVINDQLQEVSKVIMLSMTNENEFEIEEVNTFVKKLADLADKYKISIDSISPKVVSADKPYLVEQKYSLTVECIKRIVSTFPSDVRPLKEDKSKTSDEIIETRYKVTFELSVFMIIKEA